MQLLSSIASSRGTTIVCSLHQPRPQVYDALDRVLLMSRGEVAFFGPPSSTAAHFISIGRPLGGAGADADADAGLADEDSGVGEGAAGVGLADAMLDVVGDAEMAVDGNREEAQDGGLPSSSQLVVMPREELLAEVRCGARTGSSGSGGRGPGEGNIEREGGGDAFVGCCAGSSTSSCSLVCVFVVDAVAGVD